MIQCGRSRSRFRQDGLAAEQRNGAGTRAVPFLLTRCVVPETNQTAEQGVAEPRDTGRMSRHCPERHHSCTQSRVSWALPLITLSPM